MYSILLIFIYLAFISLGLPDSLLGAGWPAMRDDLGVPTSYAGILFMLIAFGTIVSSLLTDLVVRRLGTCLVTAGSILLSALGLLGFVFAPSFAWLCLCTIPYGLGGGAVDAALNHYVATHYAARHMSWLHCFWGVGVSISPYMMSFAIMNGLAWQGGYVMVCGVLVLIALALFASFPLWRQHAKAQKQQELQGDAEPQNAAVGLKAALRLPGIPYALITFFGYCALESTAGLWASTYLVEMRGISLGHAAAFASMFFMGIMVGRFVNGFLSDHFKDAQLVTGGISLLFVGAALVALPWAGGLFSLIGLVLLGLGCAPIYPSLIHAAPRYFGRQHSQAVISLMMASAYLGSTLMPFIFGLLSDMLSLQAYPLYLFAIALLMFLMVSRLARFAASS